MYALCPPKFNRIGNECYFVSKIKVNWLDAHFECKDRNSKLAEPLKFDDKALRKNLIQKDIGKDEKETTMIQINNLIIPFEFRSN